VLIDRGPGFLRKFAPPNSIETQSSASSTRDLHITFALGSSKRDRQRIERYGDGRIEHETRTNVDDFMGRSSSIPRHDATSFHAQEKPRTRAISKGFVRWMDSNGWWGRTDPSLDGTTNNLDMSSLLRRFGHVHQIASSTTVDEWTRWISTLGTWFEDPKQTSTCQSSTTLDRGFDTVAWCSPGDEDAQAIFEAPDTCSTCRERIDEHDLCFCFDRRFRRRSDARPRGQRRSISQSVDHRRKKNWRREAGRRVVTGRVLRVKRFVGTNRRHFMETR